MRVVFGIYSQAHTRFPFFETNRRDLNLGKVTLYQLSYSRAKNGNSTDRYPGGQACDGLHPPAAQLRVSSSRA